MAFTMHSHSGQFCPGHAADQLENIIKHAISVGYKTIGLTEHMPRYTERDLYPEEVRTGGRGEITKSRRSLANPRFIIKMDDPEASLQVLGSRHEAYLQEAQRLQIEYASQIHILIGFEAEFIRPEYGPLVKSLAEPIAVDYFIGSLHHVHSIPIDYNKEMFGDAVAAANGSEEQLFEDYYDLQYEMLKTLKPKVIGHFDLVRLMSEDPARDMKQWKGVWSKIMRNLECAAQQGGWLECNTAALRKGLAEPYPCRQISEVSEYKLVVYLQHLANMTFPLRNGLNSEANSQFPTIAMASLK